MKILYISCHEVLEFDELSMFADLGIEVFSVGAYLLPHRPFGESLRPPIPNLRVNADDLASYFSLVRPGDNPQKCLTPDFLDRFDAVIVMHRPDWVEACLNATDSVPIIWRTIGQSNPQMERRMALLRANGLRIVRYSPRERMLENYCGNDAVIRFGKSLRQFEPWSGDIGRVTAFSNRMKDRSRHTGYEIFRKIVEPFECDLYGIGNEEIADLARGPVTSADQFHVLARYRALVYTGTCPASYTLGFMEAWLAGIPIVALGRALWNMGNGTGHLYEIPDLITHGYNGFISNSIDELQAAIRLLLNDADAGMYISLNAREAATRHFDARIISNQWRDFLNLL